MRTHAQPVAAAKARTRASLWAAWSSPQGPLSPPSSTQAPIKQPHTHCPTNQPAQRQSLQLRILKHVLFPCTRRSYLFISHLSTCAPTQQFSLQV